MINNDFPFKNHWIFLLRSGVLPEYGQRGRVGVLHCGGTAVCRWQVFLGAHGIFPWDNPDVFFYLKMYGFGGIINGILWDYMGLYELKQ